MPLLYHELILSHVGLNLRSYSLIFRNPTEFYRIWIVTLCISSNVTEKENDDYVPFFNWFLFFVLLTMTMILRLSV
jgi:hypothetical protein